MHIDGLPDCIPRKAVLDALTSWGIDVNRVESIQLAYHTIRVTIYAENELGQRWIADSGGSEYATHKVDIPLTE